MGTRQDDREGTIRYDLDLLAGHKLGPADHPRIAPYLEQPMAARERRCPACGRHYGRRVEVRPHDGRPTNRIVVTRPFLWLG
jgi:uncharacterized Zn-finger protein